MEVVPISLWTRRSPTLAAVVFSPELMANSRGSDIDDTCQDPRTANLLVSPGHCHQILSLLVKFKLKMTPLERSKGLKHPINDQKCTQKII